MRLIPRIILAPFLAVYLIVIMILVILLGQQKALGMIESDYVKWANKIINTFY